MKENDGQEMSTSGLFIIAGCFLYRFINKVNENQSGTKAEDEG